MAEQKTSESPVSTESQFADSIERGDDFELDQLISDLVSRGAATALESVLEESNNAELARAISLLDNEERGRLIDLVGPEQGADLVEQLPPVQAIQLLEEAQPDQAAAVFEELPSDLQADLLSDLETEDAEAILTHMRPAEVEVLRRLREYGELTAGGLMITEFVRFPATWTVEQVVDDLQTRADEYRDYQIQYAYVCSDDHRLLGVLRLRDLLLGDRNRKLREIMIPNPLSVSVDLTLEELHGFFQQHHFLGVPAVDEQGRLVGVVQRTDVDQAWIEQQDRSFLRRQGIVSGEEIRALPLNERAFGRLKWLSLNIVLNLISVVIISQYESTLAAVIALTAFLPIISDMSGCSGNQAVAVSIRELMLGLVTPKDLVRVWFKEISVGVINGAAVGLLLGCIAWAWEGNLVLGLVIGLALAINTMVAVSIGGVVPLVLRKFGRDPAVASGPLLTTVTDMCGFFLVLSLASACLSYLR